MMTVNGMSAANANDGPARPGLPRDDRLPAAPGRKWRRSRLGLVIAAIVILAMFGIFFIADAYSPSDTGPRLTHKIARGDLLVTVTEQGILESAENAEIKCQVRGLNTVIWVVESGTVVEPGDELVRIDTRFIEEQIDERTKYALWSRSAAEQSKAQVARAELADSEYEQGRYVSNLLVLQKELAVAESRVGSSRDVRDYVSLMRESGYVSELVKEDTEFGVRQATLNLELAKTRIEVLTQFTRAEQLQVLKGNLAASRANHKANVERAMADASRRDRALEEFKLCVVSAERGGLVIHPSAARWENAPEIAEGASVYKDQVLLLMPDLSQMQVKIGVHESVVDRMKTGLHALVTLPDRTIGGTVSEVASVTRPAGWWSGNEVRYDTLIELPQLDGLRPGMSAEVEILVARYDGVLTVPVAAVVEADEGAFCWVKTSAGVVQRTLVLGDDNGVFASVTSGLEEGEEVLLNPLALKAARALAVKRSDKRADPKN